jgi:diphthamide synthase (EF-2-diphthine--ammonia ligase)
VNHYLIPAPRQAQCTSKWILHNDHATNTLYTPDRVEYVVDMITESLKVQIIRASSKTRTESFLHKNPAKNVAAREFEAINREIS